MLTSGFALTSAVPAGAAGVAGVATAPVDVTHAGNVASALAAARALGHRVQVDSLLGEQSTTYAESNGTMTAELADGPVRVQKQDGSFASIDTTLVTDASGVHPISVVGEPLLSAGGGTTLVSLAAPDGTRASLGWPTALPVPVIAGDTATYPNVQVNTDLVIKVLAVGVDVQMVLKARPVKAPSFHLPLTLNGITASREPATGAVRLLDKAGTPVMAVGAARMWGAAKDSAGVPSREASIMDTMSTVSTRPQIDIAPASAFLQDPAVTYPVTIDPTLTRNVGADAYVRSTQAGTNYGTGSQLWAGKVTSPEVDRTYLAFSMSGLTGTHILGATLNARNIFSYLCTPPSAASLYKVTQGWSETGINWGNKPQTDTTALAMSVFANGASNGPNCPNPSAYVSWTSTALTNLVKDWVSGAAPGYGLQIGADEVTTCCGKMFSSREAGAPAYLSVNYNSYPNTVAGRSTSPSLTPAATTWVSSLTPLLTTQPQDPDGGTTQANVEVYNSTGTTLITSGNAGMLPQAQHRSWQVPAGKLVSGTAYEWRAKGYDGTDLSLNYSSWLPFTVDTSLPTAPAVSSTTYPANAWHAAGGSGTFTLSASDTVSGVDHYLYGLDSTALNQATLSGVSSILYATMPDGWHTLKVAAVDKAGNIGASTIYQFGATPAVTGPAQGLKTQGGITLSAVAASGTTVSYKYRRAVTDPFVAVPFVDLQQAGVTLTGWPSSTATTVGASPAVAAVAPPVLTWNLAHTLGDQDGSVQVQVCFDTACSVTPVDLSLNENAFGDSFATASVGPGSVSLQTGNYSVSAGDVSVPAYSTSLTVGRTFNSRTPNTPGSTGPLGPGWQLALPSDGVGSDWVALTDTGAGLTLTGSDGATSTFSKTGTTSYAPTGDDTGSGEVILASGGDSNGAGTFTLTDLDDNVTTFTAGAFTGPPTTATPHAYAVATTVQASSVAGGMTTTFGAALGLTRVVLAPAPSGVSCGYTLDGAGVVSWTSFATGCRALEFSYAGTPARLTAVTFDVNTGAGKTQIDVACYSYDASNRLAQEWDPRTGAAGTGTHPVTCGSPTLPTAYAYVPSSDPVNEGKLASVTPAGLAALQVGYDSSGRFSTSTRTHTGGSYGTGSETSTVAYGVPLTADAGAPAHPEYRPAMQPTDVAAWAQTDAPYTAAVVYGPGDTVSSTDLRDGQVHYLDVNGREVNTAGYSGTGAAGWHVDTTEFDGTGNIVRTLTASNRELALNPTSPAGIALGLPTDPAAAALALSDVSQYATGSDGVQDLTDTYGPYHQVSVGTDGTVSATPVGARLHTHYGYDTGGELGHPTPTTTLLHLLTSTVTAASLSLSASPVSETDIRTSTTAYALGTADGLPSTEDTGWKFREPMKTVTDATGTSPQTTVTRYDSTTGAVIESRMPGDAAAGGHTGTSVTGYYTIGTNSAFPACSNHQEWANLPCQSGPAAQPGVTGLPGLATTTTSSYDYLLRPLTVTEAFPDTAGTIHTRTSTTSYLNIFNSAYDPRPSSSSMTATVGGSADTTVGAVVPARSTLYATATGLPESVTTAVTTENPAAMVQTSSYDDFGRPTGYTEGPSGAPTNDTVTAYDGYGRVSTVTDTHLQRSLTYNSSTELRGLVTAMTVKVGTALGSGSPVVAYTGSFTGGYDSDGRLLTQTDPNGVTMTLERDEDGQLLSLTDTVGASQWLSDTATANIYGQWLTDAHAAGVHRYKYDTLGRLVQGDNAPAGIGCSTRTYSFAGNVNSNRTSSTAFGPASDLSCQTSTSGGTSSHSYDVADRLLSANGDTGLGYDIYGRITTLPAADAGGTSPLTNGYYQNDLVRSQTQNGSTQCWSLDASQRRTRAVTYTSTSCAGTVSTDKLNHYTDPSSDNASWISEDTSGAYTANITDLNGNLSVTVNQAGTPTYQYSNLHGDTLATATNNTTPAISTDYDEYGNTTDPTPHRYGWLGGKQRSSEALGGVVLMGVRLYNPTLGRFLGVDPVAGGSANDYDYADQDPVNRLDLTGRASERGGGGYGIAVSAGGSWRPIPIMCGGPCPAWAIPAGLGIAIYVGGTFAADNLSQYGGFGSTAAPSNRTMYSKTGKFWKGTKPFRGKTRTNGKSGRARRYYEYDHTHGDIEEYDNRGNHLGSLDPDTGVRIKPPVKGRKINV